MIFNCKTFIKSRWTGRSPTGPALLLEPNHMVRHSTSFLEATTTGRSLTPPLGLDLLRSRLPNTLTGLSLPGPFPSKLLTLTSRASSFFERSPRAFTCWAFSQQASYPDHSRFFLLCSFTLLTSPHFSSLHFAGLHSGLSPVWFSRKPTKQVGTWVSLLARARRLLKSSRVKSRLVMSSREG